MRGSDCGWWGPGWHHPLQPVSPQGWGHPWAGVTLGHCHPWTGVTPGHCHPWAGVTPGRASPQPMSPLGWYQYQDGPHPRGRCHPLVSCHIPRAGVTPERVSPLGGRGSPWVPAPQQGHLTWVGAWVPPAFGTVAPIEAPAPMRWSRCIWHSLGDVPLPPAVPAEAGPTSQLLAASRSPGHHRGDGTMGIITPRGILG